MLFCGILASIQNNENGDPFWIVSGNWRTNLLDIANQSQTASQENMTGQGTSAPVFNTSVRMINFNGTGEHTHSITNFALESVIMPNNMTTIFNGTSTANFREGPITDIPTTITFTNDKVISIWLDPTKSIITTETLQCMEWSWRNCTSLLFHLVFCVMAGRCAALLLCRYR